MTHSSESQPEAFELVDYLVGPFAYGEVETGEQAGEVDHGPVEDWQVPFYNVALGSLRRLAGRNVLEEQWMPGPLEGAELYRELAETRKMLRMFTSLKEYVHDYQTGTIETVLRDDQKETFEGLVNDIIAAGAERDITVKAATGTGKTVIITEFVKALKYKERPNEPVRIIVQTPTKDILAQTVSAFERFAPGVDLGVYFGEAKNLREVTPMTYRSYDLAVRRGLLRRDMVDAIVKDEEHESHGRKTVQSLKAIIHEPEGERRKLVVGLSATPLNVENLAHEIGLLEAVGRGILSPISVRGHKTQASIHEQSRFRKFEDYDPEELVELIDSAPRNEIIIKEILKGLASGQRVMARCLPGGELLHPRLLNERLRKITTTIVDPYTGAVSTRKIRPVVISGTMSMHDRKLLRSAFNNPFLDGSDGLDVLLFVDTLVRGFDSPIAKRLINGCPSRSWKVMEQLLGRITRPFERRDGTLVYGEAVDLIDNAKPGQVLFKDVINKYAPEGQRYIPGAIIGPGLRDMRDKFGRFSAFEDIPLEERIRAAAAAEASARRELDEASVKSPKTGKPSIRSSANGTGVSSPNMSVFDGGSTKKRDISDSRVDNPFDEADELAALTPGEHTSLADAATALGISDEVLEDAIMERGIRLVTYGSDAAANYYLTNASYARLKAYMSGFR